MTFPAECGGTHAHRAFPAFYCALAPTWELFIRRGIIFLCFLTSFPNVEFSRPCVAYLNKRQCNWHLAEKCEWLVKGGRKWRRQQEQRWAKKGWGRCLFFFFLFGWPILWGFRFSLPSGSQRTERVSPKCVCVCVCVCLPVYFRFHLSLTGRFVLRPSASKLCNLAHEMYFPLPSF